MTLATVYKYIISHYTIVDEFNWMPLTSISATFISPSFAWYICVSYTGVTDIFNFLFLGYDGFEKRISLWSYQCSNIINIDVIGVLLQLIQNNFDGVTIHQIL